MEIMVNNSVPLRDYTNLALDAIARGNGSVSREQLGHAMLELVAEIKRLTPDPWKGTR